ncbi:MAG TPA: enoyl-ACP reductase [Flavobacteriales bacterium]|nr:enoyl-ACP reductase [Flavobacteriales bacterium]
MGHDLLKGKRGIIFGALDEKSIAWKVAEKAHEEGAIFTLTNAPVAMRMGAINRLADATNSELIPADATSNEDLKELFSKSMEVLGGPLDFVLHSIGMSPNVRKRKEYTGLNYDWYHKTLDISAMSFHRVLSIAMKMDALNEWASVLALSYIAAQRVFPDYNDMADAKALLEAITRNFGYQYGSAKKVRINTISQSPTVTTAGTGVKGFDSFMSFAESMSPLGNATADECANYCVMMFSDFTRKVTMQNLFHDGGFSYTGVSQGLMERFSPEQE